MDYKSIKEIAAEVRAAYKEKGWSNRKISVVGEYVGYSDALRVNVKDLSIPLDVVKEIAEQHEHISRDERSYEILSGGNTYVTVKYDQDAINKEAEKLFTEAEVFLSKIGDIEEGGFLVFEEWETEYNVRQIILHYLGDNLRVTVYDVPKNYKKLKTYAMDRICSYPIFTPKGFAFAVVEIRLHHGKGVK